MQEQEQERAKKGNRDFGFSFSILPPIGGCGPTFPRVATAVERPVSVLDLKKKKKWDDDNSNNNEKDEQLIEAMDLAER